jgi:hypothetical protein
MQRRWTARNPDYWAERRLRESIERLKEAETPPALVPPPAHLRRIPLEVVQAEIGRQLLAIIVFLERLRHRALQAEIRAQVHDSLEQFGGIPPAAPQAEMAPSEPGT